MRRATLLVLLLTLACCPPAAQADDAAPLFDSAAVAAIDITLPDFSRTALNADPETYQPATLNATVGGTTLGPFSVSLKLKGHASFRDLAHKAAFKVKFAKGKPLLGLKKLTLNNMVQDASMLHETLAYQTFRAAGVPAPRTGYATVRVNGEAYGVYLNVETLDDVFLKRTFATTGHLYEAGYGIDADPEGVPLFEIDEGDANDRSDLEGLATAAAGTDDFSDALAGRADLAEMVRMWAVEKYVGHWDGYAGKDATWTPNNYYLHSTTGGVFSMLPWGADQTWEWHLGFGTGGLLFRRCRSDPSCNASFRSALADVAAAADGLDLPAEARRLAAMLVPYQEADPRMESTMRDIGKDARDTEAFATARSGEVSDWLEGPKQPPPGGASASPSGQVTAPPAAVGTSAAGSAQARRAARLAVGQVIRGGAVLSTPVRLPAAGPVSQRMTMRAGGRTITACSVPSRRLGAGRHTLRCRLRAGARSWLRHRPLRLSVRTRLGGAPTVRGTAVLPRA